MITHVYNTCVMCVYPPILNFAKHNKNKTTHCSIMSLIWMLHHT